ncbi:MAG: trigger factor [Acidobacteria bacterium]|nr:trigger factor [Acidobacteriota bacterium]
MDSATCKKELVIEIPPDIVRQEADAVTAQYRRAARIPGFRPGRAPASLVRRRFEEDIRNEVVQSLLPKYFETAVKDQGMSVVGRPRFGDLKFTEDQPLTCTVTFEVLPDFDLKDYKGVEVSQEPAEVAEAELAQALQQLQERAATFEVVEDRTADDGDYAIVNYHGRDAGDPKADPVEAHDAMVHLAGEGTVAAFTENLRGSKPGDVREFQVTYVDDYSNKSLAGKTLSYRVEIQGVKRKVVPALDDEFAKSVSEYRTLEELKAKVSENLTERKKHQVEAQAKQQLLEQLISAHEFPVPESMVEAQIDANLERLLTRLMAQGIDVRSVDFDWRKLREDSRPGAEKDVRGSLILEKVAEAEGIEVPESELDEVIRDLAQEHRESPATLKTRLTHEGNLSRINQKLRNQKALDLIYQNAKINSTGESSGHQEKS